MAYGRKMMGEGLTYHERQKEQVECGDCGKGVAAGSLEAHRMIQHGKANNDKWICTVAATGGGGETYTYRIDSPTKGGTRE